MQRASEDKNMNNRPHAFHLENREKAALSGVLGVDSYDEHSVYARTTAGTVQLSGQDLKICKLNLEEGQLVVEGLVRSLTYQEKDPRQGGLFSRVFK